MRPYATVFIVVVPSFCLSIASSGTSFDCSFGAFVLWRVLRINIYLDASSMMDVSQMSLVAANSLVSKSVVWFNGRPPELVIERLQVPVLLGLRFRFSTEFRIFPFNSPKNICFKAILMKRSLKAASI